MGFGVRGLFPASEPPKQHILGYFLPVPGGLHLRFVLDLGLLFVVVIHVELRIAEPQEVF